MTRPTVGLGAAVALALLASGAALPVAAQQIDPQRPSSTQQRGSLGPPFQGFVEDLEVIGPDRFALTISDRLDGAGVDRMQVYSGQDGPVGQMFAPPEGKIYDVEPAYDGGVWALYYSADETKDRQSSAGGMRLQRLGPDGKPVGASRLLGQSLFTDSATFDQPRRGWIIPLPSGAVAVAFTTFDTSRRRHQLRLTTFRRDGSEGFTDILEVALEHLPSVSVRQTENGGALLAWGSGDPLGERIYLTRLEPDGQWADMARRVWDHPAEDERTFDVRLVPITGSDDIAAVFTLGHDQAFLRFDQDGFSGLNGLKVVNSTAFLIEPLRVDEGRLIGLTDGTAGGAGLYAVGNDGDGLVPVGVLDARITAFAEESHDSIVVAAVVPAASSTAVEGPNFSYLYRIKR